MRITVNANEYAASQNLVKLIIESIDEMTKTNSQLKSTTLDECHKALVELQSKTTAISEISYSEESLTIDIKEEFVVELFDELYTPVTKKVIRLVLVTIDTLKGIMMDAKAAASIFVKKWTK